MRRTISAPQSGFSELAPAGALGAVLERIWTWSPEAGEFSGKDTVVPDNCSDVIVAFAGHGTAPALWIVGTMTVPVRVERSQQGYLVGLRFRPGRLPGLLGIAAHELTDACIPVEEFSPRLARRLRGHLESGGGAPPDVAESIVAALGERSTPSGPLLRAIDLLQGSRGQLPIDAVARDLAVTRQHLARLFKRGVGVSPKLFSRVERVRAAARMRSREGGTWSRIAHACGYADQSHLILDYNAIFGGSPTGLTG
jgi:AraC-like DNA-binding protein